MQRVNPHTVRIENIDRIRTAYIFRDVFCIAELVHEYSSLSSEFDWVIRVDWDTWDKMAATGKYVMDIAGIDDTLRKKEYIRNYNPEFVTQRTITDDRADLRELLDKIHLRSNDLFEVLCRTHGICGNDVMYVSRFKDGVIPGKLDFVPPDIPDFDTDCYGWIQEDGTIAGYGKCTPQTINCLQRM